MGKFELTGEMRRSITRLRWINVAGPYSAETRHWSANVTSATARGALDLRAGARVFARIGYAREVPAFAIPDYREEIEPGSDGLIWGAGVQLETSAAGPAGLSWGFGLAVEGIPIDERGPGYTRYGQRGLVADAYLASQRAWGRTYVGARFSETDVVWDSPFYPTYEFKQVSNVGVFFGIDGGDQRCSGFVELGFVDSDALALGITWRL
jgi:hypothetical protein